MFHAVVEQDHAVSDILLETVARECSLATLTGDDGSDTSFFQPPEQATELRADDCFIGQCREEGFECIEYDSLGFDRINRIAQPQEKCFEIVFTSFFYFRTLDEDVFK